MNDKCSKIFQKIVNIILDIAIFIFGVILLISIYNNIQTKVLKNSYSSFFGYSIFGVQTGSMSTAINAGDWIIVKNNNDIKLNDVVTYMQDGEFITHRVVESYKDTFVTQGDANNTKDEPISREQIVGKVVKILPNFEVLKKTLFNPVVLIAIIITLYLAVFLFKKKDKSSLLKVKIDKLINKLKTKLEEKRNLPKIKVEKIKDEKPKEEVVKVEEVHIEPSEVEASTDEALPDEVTKEELEDAYVDEDEMDKTMCFRVIAVDKSEIERAYNKPVVIEDEPIVSTELTEEVKEDVVKKNLELLKNKGKKCNNIIEKSMFIKRSEIEKIIKILLNGEKDKPNYSTIKNTFIDSYMDGRYYNYCGNINVEYTKKNKTRKLEDAICEIKEELIRKYKGTDKKYSDKVLMFANIFLLINYLDNSKKYVPLKEKRDSYYKKINKYMKYDLLDERKIRSIVDEIIKVQKLHASMIKYSLNKLDTNMFKLKYNRLSVKDMYAVELIHNVSFSKVYSDYIVDKTYSSGVVAEDKISVLLTILSVQIINDMLNADFSKKYVVYIPESIYEKDNKLGSTFELFKDEYAKNNIIVLINYDGLSGSKNVIKKLIKLGYHFAVDINGVTKFKISDQEYFELMDHLFISSKNPNKSSMLIFINSSMHNKVIYDDISNKVGNYMR